MTKSELNKAIRKLDSELFRMSFGGNEEFFKFVDGEATREFVRLYHADDSFKSMTRQSVLIMFRLNLRHKFISLNQFGENIEID